MAFGLFRFRFLDVVPAARDAVIENMRDGVVVLDAKNRIVDINPAAEGILGRSASAVIGQLAAAALPAELSPPDGHGETPERQREVALGNRERHFDVAESPLYDKRGRPSGHLILLHDITERKRWESTLRESEERYRDLVENAPELICTHDLEGRLVSVNRAAVKSAGFSREEEMVGRNLSEFLPPKSRALFPEYLATLRKESRARGLMQVLTRTGEKRILEYDNSLRTEGVEEPIARGVARDVTERVRMEEELRFQKTLLECQTETAMDGIVVVSRDRKWLSYNQRFVEMWGLPDEVARAGSSEQAIQFVQPMLLEPEQFRSGIEYLYEHPKDILQDEVRLEDGRVFERYSAAVIGKDGTQYGRVWYYRDITERKRAAEALNQRTTELVAANEELEAFTHSVSHDLRAPLRHINLLTQFLEEDYRKGLDEEAVDQLTRIRETARHMSDLVDDLLELSKFGRWKLQPQLTELGPIVEEVRRSLEMETEGRKVDWEVGPLPSVGCDASLVKYVFSNLLSNAVKYTGPRKRAVITVGYKNDGNGQPVFFVRDNGVGFDMKYAERIFRVFERLHGPEEFEGTGAGLATVDRIIDKHGGRVWAEAEPDQGACFYFTLG